MLIVSASDSFNNALTDLLPRSMIPVVLDRLDISYDLQANSFPKPKRRQLVELLKAFPVELAGKGDLARAVLEGVAFSLKQTYDRVSPEGTAERVILAGGGSKSPLWRQIFADVFGLPVVTLDGAGEGSGFGAAVVAGIGCGVFSSASEAAAKLTIKTETLPIPENVAACREICKKYSGLYGRLAGL